MNDLEYMTILNYVLHCFYLQKISKPHISVCFKLLKELSFYNTSIEKPCIKLLNKVDLQLEIPFYNELNTVKTSKAFKRYARSNTEIIDLKDPSVQLTASKPITENLLDDLLNEIKGFKYQITAKVLFSKYKENEDI